MTSPIHVTLADGTVVNCDMVSCALNAGHWDISRYLLDKYHSASPATFKKQLTNGEAAGGGKAREHQSSSRQALAKCTPQFQIALEFFAEELESKRAIEFVLDYFSAKLRAQDIDCAALTFDDIRSDAMTPLQKAVSLNKVELVKKFVDVFEADVEAATNDFPLPPIFIAASKRKVRSTEFLIRAGAKLNYNITVNMEKLRSVCSIFNLKFIYR